MFVQFNVVGQIQKDSRDQVFPSLNKTEADITKSVSCSETSEGTIPLIDCDDLGTADYNTNSLLSTVNSSSTTLPASGPTCWGGTQNAGNWSVYDLSPGGTSLMIELESFGIDIYIVTFFG